MESYKQLPKSKDIVKVTVSGQTFSLRTKDVLAYPSSVLAKSVIAGNSENVSHNRPISSFQAIVGLYQTGELHMPSNICPKEFENELQFWGFSVETMEPCCLNLYRKFVDETNKMAAFRDTFKRTSVKYGSGSGTVKEKVWLVLENRTSSKIASIYLSVAMFVMMVSMVSLSISTMSEVKQLPDKNEIRRFVEEKASPEEYSLFEDFLDSLDDDVHIMDAILQELYYNDDYDDEEKNNTKPDSDEIKENNSTKPKPGPDIKRRKRKNLFQKLRLTRLRRKNTVLKVIDGVVLTFFSIELLVRLITCPNLPQYFKSPLNVLDALVTVLALIEIGIEEMSVDEKFRTKGTEILLYFQMLRVFRVFRIVKNVTAIQVLAFSFKTNYRDFLVLLLYIGIALILFGCLFYFVEDTKNISDMPEAFWLCLITMTTVGYGDLVPKSIPGKFIGGLCALTGVLLLALIIPVFVGTFVTVYEFARCNQTALYGHASGGKSRHGHRRQVVEPLNKVT